MEVKAISRHLRISPKKTRLVARVIRGLNVRQAEAQLKFIPRKAGYFLAKTLQSALANAEHNFGLKKENLYIKTILVNEGTPLKRWMPGAFGRANPIKKRSSHIEVILGELKPAVKPAVAQKHKKEIPTEQLADMPRDERVSEPLAGEGGLKVEPRETEEKAEIFDARRKGSHRHMQHRDKLGLRRAGGAIKRMFRRKTI